MTPAGTESTMTTTTASSHTTQAHLTEPGALRSAYGRSGDLHSQTSPFVLFVAKPSDAFFLC